MDLKPFENIPAGTYSGGNKRKLQVAIAMIGSQKFICPTQTRLRALSVDAKIGLSSVTHRRFALTPRDSS